MGIDKKFSPIKAGVLIAFFVNLCFFSSNSFADTVSIEKKYKSDTSGADYKYGSNKDHWTSKLKVTYQDGDRSGNSYTAMCIDARYETPTGATKTVSSISDSTKSLKIKKILLASPIGNSSINSAFTKKYTVWTSLASSESGLTTKVNDQYALFHVAAGYVFSGKCSGWGSDVCKARVKEVMDFFDANDYSSTLDSFNVGFVAQSNNQQPIAWLEPASTPPPTPTVSSTTLSSTTTRSKSSVNLSYSGTDTDTVTFYHTVSRTTNADITNVPYKVCYSNGCSPSTNMTMTGSNSGNLNQRTITIARGDTSGFGTGANANTYYIAPGDSKNICEYIRFSPTTYYSDGTSNESTGSSSRCVTVSRDEAPEVVWTSSTTDSDATSLGRVLISPANSSNFSCTGSTNGSTCTANNGTTGSQTFNITYQLRRTDTGDPSGAQAFKYAKTKTQYDKTSGYSLGNTANLDYNVNYEGVNSGTQDVTITVGGGSETICGYLTYQSKIYFTTTHWYADGVFDHSDSPVRTSKYDVGKAYSCITVNMPIDEGQADFSGEVNISPSTSYTNLSCSGNVCYASRDGTYTFNRFYKITRTDSNSNTLATKVKYSISSSSYPSSAETNIPSAIAYNSSPKYVTSLAADTPSVTFNSSNRGGSQSICGYMRYQNIVYYKTESGTTTENTGKSGNRGTSTAYKCVTVYAPPADQTQNYLGSSSFLTGTNLDSNLNWNNSKSAYIGKEGTGSYTLKFNHEISRDSPDNSANIPDAWATNTYSLKSGTSSTGTMSAISGTGGTNTALNSSTHKISSSHDYTLSANSNTSNTYCEQLNYKSSVTYAYGNLAAGDRSYGSSTNTTRACATVIRPAYAAFDGRIVIASTWNGNQYSTDSGEEGSLTGSGMRKRYGFQILFQMRRTDTDSLPASSNTRFMTSYGSSSSQPTSYSGTKSSNLSSTSWTTVETVSADAIDIPIGTTSPVSYCAYLSYDTTADYYGSSTPEGRGFTGRKKYCVKITNPALSYTASFTATSAATNPGLRERADGTWEVINYSYNNTNGRTYSNANLPKTISVAFAHTLKRTDTGTASFTYSDADSGKASTRYVIQESLNGAAYSNVSGGSGTKNNFTQSGTAREQIVASNHSFTFTRSGTNPVGSIVNYCQKIVYDRNTTYTTADSTNVESYSVNKSYSGYDGTSTAKCITIRNPNWSEYYDGNINFPITVTGSTILAQNFMNLAERTHSNGKSPLLTGTTENHSDEADHSYTVNAVNVTAKFEHELRRGVENFSEDPNFTVSPLDGTSSYNFTLAKPTDKVGPAYTVDQIIDGTRTSLTGTTLTGDYLGLRDGSNIYFEWNSYKKTSGTTSTSLNGSSLVAGQNKRICHKIVPGTHNYHISYQKRWRQETYTDSSKNGTPWQIRVDRESSSPVSDGTVDNATPICVDVTRPYNYEVDNITGNGLGESPIGYPGDEKDVAFTISVKKEDTSKNYITDMPELTTSVAVFGFIVNESVASTPNYVKNSGTSTESLDRICSTYYAGTTCNVLRENDKPSSHVGTGVYSGSSYSSGYSISTTIPTTLPVGAKYCVSMGIKNLSSAITNSNKWFISKAACVTVGKKPTMQVWGGSVLANGKITTSISSKGSGSNKFHFGSWTDFALISGDDIFGMASGATLSGGNKNATDICDKNNYSPLTLANDPCKTSGSKHVIGRSVNSRDASGFYEKIKDKLVDESSINSTTGLYNSDGTNYKIHYSKNNNLVISSNVINNTSNAIKQIIYITDKDILIDQNVTRVDAWLITKGDVYTCSISGVGQTISDLNSDKCKNPLVINGPVYANNIILSRTYGADASKNDGDGSLADPAEIIDFIPSTYIWGYNKSRESSSPQIVYLKELSPRY